VGVAEPFGLAGAKGKGDGELGGNCFGNLRAFWELQHQENGSLGTSFLNKEL
jgi:hypothetical protein